MVLMGLKLRESFIIGRLPCYFEPIKFLYLHEFLLRLNIGCMFLVRLFGCLVLLLICICEFGIRRIKKVQVVVYSPYVQVMAAAYPQKSNMQQALSINSL